MPPISLPNVPAILVRAILCVTVETLQYYEMEARGAREMEAVADGPRKKAKTGRDGSGSATSSAILFFDTVPQV